MEQLHDLVEEVEVEVHNGQKEAVRVVEEAHLVLGQGQEL